MTPKPVDTGGVEGGGGLAALEATAKMFVKMFDGNASDPSRVGLTPNEAEDWRGEFAAALKCETCNDFGFRPAAANRDEWQTEPCPDCATEKPTDSMGGETDKENGAADEGGADQCLR